MSQLSAAFSHFIRKVLSYAFGWIGWFWAHGWKARVSFFATVAAALVFLVLPPGDARAADYGSFGAVFPVEEPSILDTIYSRLSQMEANGELAAMEADMKATARERIRRPRPVVGLAPVETDLRP